jgi:c-di-GMP-binding flagellar brake protein YcgR
VTGAIREKKLIIGQEVKISGEKMLPCSAKVLRIQDDAMILELLLAADCPGEWLSEAVEITVAFIVPDDAIYSFSGIVSRYNHETRVLLLERLSPLGRIEQRRNFRLKTAKLVYFCDDDSDVPAKSWLQASLLDLSRGGACLLSPVFRQPGTKIKLLLSLAEVECVIETGATVVRAWQGEDHIILGLVFEGLSLDHQDRILEYIIKKWSGRQND